MSLETKQIFEFDRFRLDVEERTLERLDGTKNGTLPDKTFETLVLLVSRRGHLVTKEDLLSRIWPDTVVEENNLDKRIHRLRKYLGEKPGGGSYIETVRGRGYRFVGNVQAVEVSGSWLAETYRLPDEDQAHLLKDFAVEPEKNTNGSGPLEGEVPHPSNGSGPITQATQRRGFRKELIAAGVAGIVLIMAFLGYYGFVRKSPAGPSRSIVVLPVAPMNTAERNYLYELGIADSLINQLSSSDGLRVSPLNAVAGYADAPIDALAAGREQKADFVLASNYQIADGKIKITSQLYNVTTGQVETTLQTRQGVADVFAAQDAISADIGGRIREHLGTPARAPSKKRGTDNEEAYLAYIHGMMALDRQNPNPRKEYMGAPISLQFLERAVSLDPNYAKAWAGTALAHSYAGFPEHDRDGEDYRKALEAAEKALSIDPNESLAYTALCHVRLFYEWNYAEAEEAGRHAVELDPTSPFARSEYATVLMSRGRFDEGIDHFRKAIEMDPTSFRVQTQYANKLFVARHYEEAEAQYKRLVDLKPDRTATYSWLIRVMEAQGKEAEAFDWTVKLMTDENKGDEAIQRYKAAYQNSGYRGALPERINLGIMKVHAYVYLGNKDKAFETLEENYRRHHYSLAVGGIVDPLYDSLRSDPRWADLVKRVEAGGN